MKIKKQEELDWLHCQKTHYYLAQPAPESPDRWNISREIVVAQASRHREITFQRTLVTCSAARTLITQRLNLTKPFMG